MQRRVHRGATKTEYVILVALFLLGLLVLVTFFGNDIRGMFFGNTGSLRQGAAVDVRFEQIGIEE